MLRRRLWPVSFALVLSATLPAVAHAGDAPTPVLVLGSYQRGWLQWLGRQEIAAASAEWQETFPTEALRGRKLVVFAYVRPERCLSNEESAAIRAFLEQRGALVLTSGSPSRLAGGHDLSAIEWLGAARYVYGKIAGKVHAPGNPLVRGVTDDVLQSPLFFSRQPHLGSLTTGFALVGGAETATVLLNRVGEGLVLFVSAPPFFGAADPVGRPAVQALCEEFVRGVLGGPAERAAITTGAEAKLAAFRLRGRLRMPWIVPAAKEQQKPAAVLAEYVRQMTGARVPVSPSPIGRERLLIHVGAAQGLPPKDLHPFGFVIKLVGDDNLVIASHPGRGAGYGVYDFLRRFAGYRWFATGEIGEVVPRQDAIELPDTIDVREEPSFTSFVNAAMYGANGTYLRGWRETLKSGHNLKHILPPAKYGHEPERYCMVDGKRFVPRPKLGGTWQPCVSHPDLPRVTVEWARQFFRERPWMRGFSACVNDGGGDCHCPACDAAKAKYGNQYVPYYNATARLLAREQPGKIVDFYAYGGAAPPPTGIKLEPNLFVMVCAPFREGGRPLEGWAEAGAKHVGIYQYLYGKSYLVPRHYPHLLGNRWKEAYRKYHLRGAWIETSTCCWLYDGPRQSVLNRLAWDIDADIDALLDDYFSRFYQRAATPVRRFFDRVEQIHARKADPFHFIADRNKANQLFEYTQDDVDFLDAALGDARNLAREEALRKRVGLLSRMWQLSRLDVIARVRVKQLSRQKTDGPDAARETVRLATDACRALEEKARFTLTPWEEANLLIPRVPLDEFKRTVQQEPDVEHAIDLAFERVWATYANAGREQEAQRFFGALSARAGDSRIGALARTRLYLARHPRPANVVQNPSFEEPRKGKPAGEEETMLRRYDWTEFQPARWSKWHFQQSVTRFYWDSREFHSGQRSAAIGRNQISGCFQQYVPMKPGERYRLSLWVKQKPAEGAGVRVRWVNKKGWRDQGKDRVPTVHCAVPPGCRDWRQVACSFTVPEDVSHAVVLLSAPRQDEGEMTWFDDVTIEKILPAD